MSKLTPKNSDIGKEKSITFHCLIKKEEDLFIAHCLELDIVATATTIKEAQEDMTDLIIAQVRYAFIHDNVDNLFKAAPAKVWKEFYECDPGKEIVKSTKPKSEKAPLNAFIPPWIIQKTCMMKEGIHG